MARPTSSPSKHELRSLALIRRLLEKARNEAEAPSPLSALALTTAHTAVEWFLVLASEHHGVEPQSFRDHWSKFDQQAGIQLTQKRGMSRLDDVRGTLKHHGGVPSQSDVESLLSRTREFLEQNTPTVFGVKLSEVSLIRLVPDEDAREKLQEAQHAHQQGDLTDALVHTAIAMEETISSVYSHEIAVPRIRRMSSFEVRDVAKAAGGTQFVEFAEKLRGELDGIYRALELLTLGIDVQRYAWFDHITPSIAQTSAGEYHVTWVGGTPSDLTGEDVQRCIDFVVETALSAHEMAPPQLDG